MFKLNKLYMWHDVLKHRRSTFFLKWKLTLNFKFCYFILSLGKGNRKLKMDWHKFHTIYINKFFSLYLIISSRVQSFIHFPMSRPSENMRIFSHTICKLMSTQTTFEFPHKHLRTTNILDMIRDHLEVCETDLHFREYVWRQLAWISYHACRPIWLELYKP